MTLISICAWCSRLIGVKTTENGTGVETTHGMCQECREKEMNMARKALEQGNRIR